MAQFNVGRRAVRDLRRSGAGMLLSMWAVLNGQGRHRSPGSIGIHTHPLDLVGQSIDRPRHAGLIRELGKPWHHSSRAGASRRRRL